MKPNSLDDIFRTQLKDQQQLPEGIQFNRRKVHTQLNERLSYRSRFRSIIGYAALVALILLSGYYHRQQQGVIDKQIADLESYKQELSRSEEHSNLLAFREKALIDSLVQSNQMAQKHSAPAIMSLLHLPAVVITHKIITTEQPILLVEVPVQIPSIEKIKSDPSTKPELNLPIYYESERLAAVNNDASGRLSFRGKQRKVIN